MAKHAWRLLNEPDSLLGQTLLNRYCLTEGILDCTAPNSASHGWRGILAGREILKKGLGWVIGDGRSTRVWRDNWLATSHQCCPIGPPAQESQDMMVNDLFLPNSTTWNVEKIRYHLPQYEGLIRKIVPSSLDMKDKLVWLPHREGKYTTKTGYALAKINVEGKKDDFNWRKGVWSVKCSPKIRQFLWKLQNKALAVGETLLKRGIQVDGRCKRYGEPETILHVMFQCTFAQNIWNSIPALGVPIMTSINSIGDLLQGSTKMINLPPIGLHVPLYPWIYGYCGLAVINCCLRISLSLKQRYC